MTPPLLSLRDITIDYGRGAARTRALHGCSFDLEPGGVMALVGESGSGKSSIARVVAGLVRPSGGQIELEGRPLPPLAARTPAMLRAIQMVFQDPGASLNPYQTIAAILDEPLKVIRHGDAARRRERIGELMDMVHLDTAFLDRRPGQLSGGEKQRVAIARALALEPRLLIADEALSALDFTTQDHISRLLAELREKLNLAMLFVSHDLRSVRRMADQVCVLERGVVLEQGPVAEVLYHPRTAYTRLLLAAALNPRAALADPRLSDILAKGGEVSDEALEGVMQIICSGATMGESA